MKSDRQLSQSVEQLKEFLRWPSVSTDPSKKGDVASCANWLADHLRSIGLSAEVHPTKGHPVVLARGPKQPRKPTVLIYGHYDVQPAEPLDLWKTPPFEPTIRGRKLFARGSTDNKGQIFAHIKAVEQAIKEGNGSLPNVIFVIEGEEEIGSSNLVPFLRKHRRELQADVVIVSDSSTFAKNLPSVCYGLRGLTALELRVYGPSCDLHSGVFGGSVANPATVLAQLLATLHDPRSWRVRVPHFYDGVLPMTPAERRQWRALPFDENSYRRTMGVPALAGEAGFTSLERRWARPTLEINGIFGGYQGEGSKTIVPAWAGAKLTARLVPNQSPRKVCDAIIAHLRKHAPASVRLEIERGHDCPAYLAPLDTKFVKAAAEALEEAWRRKPVFIREGGSIPILTSFKNILGVDSLLIGFGLPDANPHSPNENFDLDMFKLGISASRKLLAKLS